MNVERLIRKGNDPVLKTVCQPVAVGEHLPFLDTLVRVVKKHRNPTAAGLAAPQIGIAKRVIVTNCHDSKGTIATRVMINPVIVNRSNEMDVEAEGCLSYPGKSKRIRRSKWIDVEWQTLARFTKRERMSGFEARVVQHEVDHLDGICRVGDDSPAEPEEERSTAAPLAMVAAAAMAMSGGYYR